MDFYGQRALAGGAADSCHSSGYGLARGGAHARPLLPKLAEARTYLVTVKKVQADYLAQFDKLVATIESSSSTPTLINLEDFKARPSAR